MSEQHEKNNNNKHTHTHTHTQPPVLCYCQTVFVPNACAIRTISDSNSGGVLIPFLGAFWINLLSLSNNMLVTDWFGLIFLLLFPSLEIPSKIAFPILILPNECTFVGIITRINKSTTIIVFTVINDNDDDDDLRVVNDDEYEHFDGDDSIICLFTCLIFAKQKAICSSSSSRKRRQSTYKVLASDD